MACEISAALGEFVKGKAPETETNSSASGSTLNRKNLLISALAALGTGVSMSGASASALRAMAALPAPGDGTASIVFRNGAVYTVTPTNPWAQAVAVTGSSISYVGSNAGVQQFIGPQTKVIDLAGRMLMPGFIEGHIHPFLGSFFTSGVDLQYPTGPEAMKAIAEYAAANPTGPLRGFGWRMDMFGKSGPTAAELDRVVPDRPAIMFSIDCHSLWANTKALQMAGITNATPDPIPDFSFYQRDATGKPTGFVLEIVAMLPVINAVQPISVQSMADLLAGWMPKASAAGVTSLFDAAIPPITPDEAQVIQIYADFEARGELPFRVVTCHAVKGSPIDNAVALTDGLRRRFNSPLVDARMMKIVADGTQGGWTALMLEPYTDKPDTRGTAPFSQQQMTELIVAADKEGIDVHVHSCGDGTTRMALNAFEAAIAENPSRDRRNTIAHLVIVDDADLPRFAKLGVNGQFSINWHCIDLDTSDTMMVRCGPERQAKMYRPRSLLQSGARISAGTDWPAAGYYSTFKPLEAIQIGVTRKQLSKTDADPCLAPAAERLELAEALTAYTIGAAHQLRLEQKVGTIEVGKLADLIVIDKNLFEMPASQIGKASVQLTMMNGAVTHGTLG
jgi:predicted amidohydrolase YtcJ